MTITSQACVFLLPRVTTTCAVGNVAEQQGGWTRVAAPTGRARP